MKNTLFIIALVVFIGIGTSIIFKNKAVAPTIEEQKQAPKIVSSCGLTVNTPLGGSVVTFPLSIDAVVDNTASAKAGCSWTVFEAQAGGVEVKDGTGNILATGTLNTTEDWMTTGPVNFTSTISALSNPSYIGPLTLVFTEDNPSDNPNPDTLTLSVVKN